MSNARTFLWLFAYVQMGFITLDVYEHWRSALKDGTRQLLGRYRFLIVAVAGACLLYFVIQILLASCLPTIGKLIAFAIGSSELRPTPVDAKWIVPVFLAAFFTGTFFDYVVHRFLLHGFLWRLHENHHLPTVVSNVMPGIAARPFVVLPNFLINAGSCTAIFVTLRILAGRQLISTFIEIMPGLLLTFAFVASASHSIFLRRFDWAERIFRALLLITPREHLVHHAASIPGNYGNFTPLWDRIFGTYVPPQESEFAVGLEYDQDFLGAITAGRVKLSPAARSRYQIRRICNIEEGTGLVSR